MSVEACTGPTVLYQPFGSDLAPDEQLWLDDFERRLKMPPGHYQRLTGKNDHELLALIVIEQRLRPLGYTGGHSILQEYVRKVRPQLAPQRSFVRVSLSPASVSKSIGATSACYITQGTHAN
jgi:hypothetical protein